MDGKSHLIVGAVAGTTGYYLIKKYIKEEPSLVGAMISANVGALAAGVPDAVEPATSPGHRAFFHSLVFVIATGLISFKLIKVERMTPDLLKNMTILGTGYGSRLFLDMLAPAGLPMV